MTTPPREMTRPAPGRRDTRQRRAVLGALERATGFASAQAIHARLRAAGTPVGMATVYRVLRDLADTGQVDVVRDDAGEQQFRRCTPGHHHHLVCVACGRAVEVESVAVERWAEEMGRANGFTDVHHDVELFGTCSRCAGA